MALKFDAVVTQRYEQNGEEKKRFVKVGAVFEGAKGLSLKLEAIPVGFDGWINFYVPKPKETANGPEPVASDEPPRDDIPF